GAENVRGRIEEEHAGFGYFRAAGRGRVSAGGYPRGYGTRGSRGKPFPRTVCGAVVSAGGAKRGRDGEFWRGGISGQGRAGVFGAGAKPTRCCTKQNA